MNVLKEYAETKNLIATLTGKLKDLEPKVLEAVIESDEPIKNQFGTFTKAVRYTYKFDKVVEDFISTKKEEIKRIEERAVKEGKCEVTEAITPRFIPLKEKK